MISFTASAQDYKTHKVKIGETIESIAKRYMVTPFDIYALNPDTKTSLQPNVVLIIPKSRILDSPVETEVTQLLGYKSHKVKRKETLYSISKKYNITVDDIKKHNNRLYSENLQKGDRINIPNYSNVKVQSILENTIRRYTVQAKEGKWRVAYKFGISVAELESLNPNMEADLQLGQELNVPNIADNEEKIVDEGFEYYTVVQSEGFMSLERKFGLNQTQIESLNPELSATGLKVGMILKMPKDINADNEEISRSVLVDRIHNFATKKLAVMLPFRMHRVDMDSIHEVREMLYKEDYLNISLDFHSGVLMAMDSVKQLGISTSLDVYDTKALAGEVSNIIGTKDFSEYDAVIGPFIAKNFDRAANLLQRDGIPVISPVSAPGTLRDNVFQSIPPKDLMFKRMVDFVKKDTVSSRMIIISDAKHRGVSNALKREFGLAKQIFSRTDEETEKDDFYILIEDIIEELRDGKNIVFLETNNMGFVSNVASMLNALIGVDEELEIEREIILMTTNKSRAFEGGVIVSNYDLANLNFHYPSANKPLDAETTNSFVRAYEKQWHTTPNKFATRGFDLTMDILLRLAIEEDLYKASSNDIETEYVENKFRYSKKMFGGYYNEAIYLLRYEGLTIVEIKE